MTDDTAQNRDDDSKGFPWSHPVAAIVLIMLVWQGMLSTVQAGRPDIEDQQQYTSQDQLSQQEMSHVSGEVLVLLSADTNQDGVIEDGENLSGAEAAVGGKVLRRISLSRGRQVLRVKLAAGKSVENALAENWKARDKRILSVEPNYRIHILAAPNDPLLPDMWALNNTGLTGGTPGADINAIDAWRLTTGSSSVIVGVIDTGIDYLHPDLADNMWVNSGEIPGNGVDDDGNGFVDDIYGYDFAQDDNDPRDEHSHGTHVAGTIAGRGNNGIGITGVNWECKLMACRFLDANGSGSVTNAIDAINYAVANGADILCNSWGGTGYSEALKAAISNASDHGVLFVAAAGNSGDNTDVNPHYPSSYDVSNIIAVAATDHRDALAAFSSYGRETVDLAAPGVSILSSVLGGGYDWYSGTSMATPHVVGVAALLLANDPQMSLQDLKSRIIWTGEAIASLDGKTVSGRRLNAYNALTAGASLEMVSPQGGERWVHGFTYEIQWVSIGGGATVDIHVLKGGSSYVQIADDVANEGSFDWYISESLPAGSDYRIWIDDGTSTAASGSDFEITGENRDYFTQLFVREVFAFDLSNKSMMLIPDGASDYVACVKDITQLPTDPGGSSRLSLGDDDWESVSPVGESVSLYGTTYSTFYIGSNGNITFGSGDGDYSESMVEHFGLPRICGLFHDLDPTSRGQVSWKQLADRVATTWQDVPEYGRRNSNTFQIEMFFDGRIQLSWLTVEAQDGIVGLSDGSGWPVDFMETDLSEYAACEAELTSIEMSGPSLIDENSDAQYTCIAHYDDGSISDITDSDTIVWGVNSDYADISSIGYLTTTDVGSFHHCTITVSLDGKSDAQDVIIKGSDTSIISLRGFNVAAGMTDGLDRIKCSGTFDADDEDIAGADEIRVSIWAPENYRVYDESIDFDPASMKRGRYTYRNTIRKGQTGAITTFKIDTNKQIFSLSARNIDLTGLRCPLFVEIEFGGYTALAQAGEDVVNGRKPAPMKLVSGFDDMLRLEKYKIKSGRKPFRDLLLVKGAFARKDEYIGTIGDVVVRWGSQNFTIDDSSFYVRKGATVCRKVDIGNGVVSAKFDPVKCTFKIQIKRTSINQKTGSISFGLSFDAFNEVQEINL